MRAALLVLLGACSVFDPAEGVRYREYANAGEAVQAILAENPAPRVYAIGEYHQSRASIGATSPLARFTQEVIGSLKAKHLVVEAWLASGCSSSAQLEHDVAAATGRPAATEMEMLRLVRRGTQAGLVAHALPMTCIEHDAMIDASGRVDFLLLLEVITDKLATTTRALVDDGPVIVYGGALHNDLYPHWPLEELSYARPLARELGPGSVLEIDLVVPEVVESMPLVRSEPWFPLLDRAAPARVMVWQRGPGSYVLILPAQACTQAGCAAGASRSSSRCSRSTC